MADVSRPSSNPDSAAVGASASWRTAAAAVGLIAAVALAYLRSVHGEFIWDDNLHVTENPTIVGPLGLKEIWTTAHANYFPLVLTNFWVQHALWGLDPLPYHVVNVGFHALAALLLWRVLRQLDIRGAWLGAALWALHPVQVESVAWIAELKNTQSAVFFLAAIWCHVRWLRLSAAGGTTVDPGRLAPSRSIHYYGALFFAVLAILSKPSAVMLPAALGLCTWWIRGRLEWRDGWRLLPFLALSAVAAGWTIWEQKFHSGAIGPEWQQTLPERFIIAGRAVWFYLGKLLWPEPLIFIYPRWSIDAASAWSYLPLAAIALTAWLLWRTRARQGRAGLFAALYFGALLFPVLGFFDVYFFRYSFVGDHFQYLASMAPLAWLAAGLASLPRRIGAAAGAAILMGCAAVTWEHSATFHDMETLWRRTVTLHRDCRMAWLNLGDTYSRQRRSHDAIAAFRRGLEIAPDDPSAHNDLGCELVLMNRAAEALPHLERAVQLRPIAEHVSNLGNALRKLGRVPEALAQYRRALELDPLHAPSHNNLGAELAEAGRYEEAVKHFATSLRLRPNDPPTHENLAGALRALGRNAEAKSHYEAALRLEPGRARSRQALAELLAAAGQPEASLALVQQGVQQAPNSPETHNHLGSTLAQAGRIEEAERHFREAIRLDPNFGLAHLNLGTALAASGRLKEAIGHLQSAARLRPELPETHSQLAVALVNSGDLEAAVAPFQQALRRRPDSAELHDNFGQLLRALGRNRDAFEHLEEAARLRRERPAGSR